MLPCLFVQLLSTVGLLVYRTGGNTWKGGIVAFSIQTGGLHYLDAFPGLPSLLALATWIQDTEVTSHMYVFALSMPQLRGGHQLFPESLAIVISHVLDTSTV
jgi:hypothetical protein